MKKNEHNSRDRYTSDFDIINRELGSMDLEPPKVYRPEQQSVIDRRNETRRRKDNGKKKKQSKPRTKNTTKMANTPATKQEQQKKRKQKKLVRKILSIAVTVIIAIIVVAVLCLTVFFKIDTINISGNSKYTKEQITSSLTITKDKNLFLVDRDNAAAKLKEALPYIHDVEISRKLPSTLNVKITETKVPYAIKNSDKTYTLLDSDLKVLEANVANAPESSITIKKAALSSALVGKQAVFTDKKVQECDAKLISIVNSMSLDKITELYSTGVGNNYIVYDGRITIKLGKLNGAEDKLYAALTALYKLNTTSPNAHGEINAFSDKQIYFTESK